ncbi:MAG TPA: GtrA family protein [Candidatus Saccharimonadales bacterium]|nr:GtrA family protein [Candidatus Saccharimonadales bacterium]
MKQTISRVFRDKTQNKYVQFFRYGFVSTLALVVDFGGLVALKQYGHINYLVAASISFIAGLIVNYSLSRLWVFHSSKIENVRYEFLLFSLIGLVGLGLTDLILWVLTSGLGLYYVLSKAVATVIVYFWNFGVRKRYVFN